MLVPTEVVEELLGVVFRVKRFFDASFALVLLAALAFLALIVSLSLRLRRNERQTLFKMGCSRGTIAWMQFAEIAVVGIGALLLAGIGAGLLVALAPDLAKMLER